MSSALTPQELLDRASAKASRSVRLARKCIGKPQFITRQATFCRRLSMSMAALAPVLLVLVIIGSLVQTNSSLIETLWEITAGAILLAGLLIATADSRNFFLKVIDQKSPVQQAEARKLSEESALAKAWLDFVGTEARALHQFDLEIMWALHEQERTKPAAPESH